MNRRPIRAPPAKKVIPTPPKKVFSLTSYEDPAVKDLAVLLVFFNPANSIRIQQNLFTVIQTLDRAKIPYYIAELAFEEHPFCLEESDRVFHYRSNSYLFYKENLINILETRVPEQYTKLCIMDADLIYEDPQWYSKLSTILDTYDVCQPYKTAIWLDLTFNKILEKSSIPFAGGTSGHEGFVWAMRRDFFRRVKFPDFSVIGSGDTVFTYALLKHSIPTAWSYFKDSVSTYMSAFPESIKMTYLDQSLYHLCHGSLTNRQYCSRHTDIIALLKSYGKTSLSEVLLYRDDGLIEVRPAYSRINSYMKDYFPTRLDDGL